jgi:hypothetical protein
MDNKDKLREFKSLKEKIKELLIDNNLVNIDYYLQSQIVWNKGMEIEIFNIFINIYREIIELSNEHFKIIKKYHKNILYIRFLLKIYRSTYFFLGYYHSNNQDYSRDKVKRIAEFLDMFESTELKPIDELEKKYFGV